MAGHVPHSERWPVQFPVRAHAWVVGLVPGWGMYETQQVNVSLSQMLLSLPLSLFPFL